MYFEIMLKIVAMIAVTAVLSVGSLFLLKYLNSKKWLDHHPWGAAFFEGMVLPFQWLIWLNVLYYITLTAAAYYHFEILDNHFMKIQEFIWVFCLTWLLLRWKARIKDIWEENQIQENRHLHIGTIEALNRLGSSIILLVAALTGLQIIGVPIQSFLAVGAVGAAGIAWASTDIIKNFFGGFMVHINRPFSIGDWISSPEKDIEGSVEEIGWYQTRIRTADKRPIYVPNGIFTAIVLQNTSRMSHRQILADIGLGYEDIKSIEVITKEIEQMLREQPDIDQTCPVWVHFVHFGSYSLDININCYTKTVNFEQWRKIQQRIFLNIANIIEQNGAKLALPTQFLQLQNIKRASSNFETVNS